MANKLREVFFPSEEKIAEIKRIADEAYNDAIKKKQCIACKHYHYDPYVQGFIYYCGDCDKDHVTFFCENPNGVCNDWKLKGETYD